MACPICAKETEQKYRPFCSKRCADIDLAKWLGGGYSIPASDIDLTSDSPEVDRDDSETLN